MLLQVGAASDDAHIAAARRAQQNYDELLTVSSHTGEVGDQRGSQIP